MSTKKHDRAKGNTTLTISLPVKLKESLEVLATADNRPVSNFVRHHMEFIVNEAEAKKQPDPGNDQSPPERAQSVRTPVRYTDRKPHNKTNP